MIIDLDGLEERAASYRTKRIMGGLVVTLGALAFFIAMPLAVFGALTYGSVALMFVLFALMILPMMVVSVAFSYWRYRLHVDTSQASIDALLGDGTAAMPNRMAGRYYIVISLVGIAVIAGQGPLQWLALHYPVPAAPAIILSFVLLDRLLPAFVAAGASEEQRANTHTLLRYFLFVMPFVAAGRWLMEISTYAWVGFFFVVGVPLAVPALRFQAAVRKEDWEAATERAEKTWPAMRPGARITAAQGREDWPTVRSVAEFQLRNSLVQNGQAAWLEHIMWAHFFEHHVDEARRTAAALLHLHPHAAAPRTLLAWLDCETGTVSPPDVALLESALEHCGRTFPRQNVSPDAFAWATLARVHDLLGNRRERDEAAEEARSLLEKAPVVVRRASEKALESLG